MHSMSSQASSWTLMGDFFVQECCVHGTDLENHGPTSILCDDPLPIESNQCTSLYNKNIDWWLHASLLLFALSPSPLVSTMSQCPNTIAGVCLLGPIYQSAGQGRGRGGRGTVSHLPVTHPTVAPGSLTPPGVETRPGQVQKYEGGECLY